MSNNLDQIVDCLRQLLQPAVQRRAAALGDRDGGPGYVYLGSGNRPALYAEALGDVPEAVDPDKPDAYDQHLTNLGWNPPLPGDVHWFRIWHVEQEAERLSAALEIQRTLEEAYGIGAEEPLTIRFASN